MIEPPQPAEPRYDDEIDLIELITNIWEEKLVIILATALTTLVGLSYAFIATPIYKVNAQLALPSTTDLAYLNQTEHFSISEKEAFSEFLTVLSSNNQLNELIKQYPEELEEAIGLDSTKMTLGSFSEIRKIEYPNTTNKINEIEPARYSISYEGIDTPALEKLAKIDIEQAEQLTLANIRQRYRATITQRIISLSRKQELDLKNLEDQLISRKAYVLESRKDRLRQLQEALNIAKVLGIQSPTSISKLATSNVSNQVEITAELNNNRDPLYLRGTNLLTAEINNLENLPNNVFLDNQIRELNAKKLIINNNREAEQLENLLAEFNEKSDVRFYQSAIDSTNKPIKPKKTLVVIISLLLGGMVGLFIAIGRITIKNYKKTARE